MDDDQSQSDTSTSGLIVAALHSHFRAKRDTAIANLGVFVNRAAGVGEHPDLLKECASLVEQIGSAEESMRVVQHLFSRKGKG